MNLSDYAALKPYTIVASAMETKLTIETDEVDGNFIWVVYHNDSTHLFIARLDVMTGELKPLSNYQYESPRDYVWAFNTAMIILFEKTTGRDFNSACPRS